MGALSSRQLRLIEERLRAVGPPPSLGSLAALCDISVRTLTRCFPKSRGCTIGAYVSNSQMEHAKDLLATNASVSSIAKTLGFASCANFSYAFRRNVGVPPKQFRKTTFQR